MAARERRSELYLTCLAALAVIAGCLGTDDASKAKSPPAAPISTADVGAVELSEIDGLGLKSFISDQQGKVLLIDFWATWCRPCVEGIEHTKSISQKYASRDVTVVTIAIDGPEQKERVEGLVESPTLTNFIATHGDDLVRAMDDFEIESGTLPTLRLYDQQGRLRQTFGDGQPEPINFEEIEVAIRSLLSGSDL